MSPGAGPDHEQWSDAAGAYALGALAAEEAAAYEAHLAGCPACRAEVDELRTAVAALPASVPPQAPPAALRDRIMADVRREAELLRAAGPEADRPARRKRRAWLPAPRWLAPAMAAGTLAVGFVLGLVVSGGDPDRTTVPLAATEAVRGAHARLVVEGGHAVLSVEGLPAPPPGRVYMVWLLPADGTPRPTSSLFVPRKDGTATVAVPTAVADAEQVLVNTEPPGGSPAPTSAPVLTARLPS